MGRNAKEFQTKLTRAMVRVEYYEAVRQELCALNLFDPSKPEHGAYSTLVDQCLHDWLKNKLTPEEFSKLPERKLQRL